MRYVIVRYFNRKFDSIVSGCGRNAGTWDSDHSRRAAYRHAKAMRQTYPEFTFRVEPQF